MLRLVLIQLTSITYRYHTTKLSICGKSKDNKHLTVNLLRHAIVWTVHYYVIMNFESSIFFNNLQFTTCLHACVTFQSLTLFFLFCTNGLFVNNTLYVYLLSGCVLNYLKWGYEENYDFMQGALCGLLTSLTFALWLCVGGITEGRDPPRLSPIGKHNQWQTVFARVVHEDTIADKLCVNFQYLAQSICSCLQRQCLQRLDLCCYFVTRHTVQLFRVVQRHYVHCGHHIWVHVVTLS